MDNQYRMLAANLQKRRIIRITRIQRRSIWSFGVAKMQVFPWSFAELLCQYDLRSAVWEVIAFRSDWTQVVFCIGRLLQVASFCCYFTRTPTKSGPAVILWCVLGHRRSTRGFAPQKFLGSREVTCRHLPANLGWCELETTAGSAKDGILDGHTALLYTNCRTWKPYQVMEEFWISSRNLFILCN